MAPSHLANLSLLLLMGVLPIKKYIGRYKDAKFEGLALSFSGMRPIKLESELAVSFNLHLNL